MPEQILQQGREGIVLDHIDRARRIQALDRTILVTDRPRLAERAEKLGAAVHLTTSNSFHFGRTLQEVVQRHALDAVLYLGGGAAPLASPLELGQVASYLRRERFFVAANNYHSADVVAFSPARAVLDVEPPRMDNLLPQVLEEAGLPYRNLPRSLGINFDVDTPSDLMVLAVHPAIGPRTAEALLPLELDLQPLREARERLISRESDVLIFGRVGGPLFAYLDENTRCRLRLFSEERGMKALGRDERGEVASLIGFLVDEVGPAGFVERLTRLADAAFLDTRVLWAHRRSTPSVADRFYSDLLLPDPIQDPFTRELTRAAREAPIPVLLGGHSLVAGGVWALMDAALRGKQELRATPRI